LRRESPAAFTEARGDEALDRLADQVAIDLLLTDLVMPSMSGSELARRFRKARPRARIMFVSGNAEAVEQLARSETRATCLEKPLVPDMLARRIRAELDRKV
jgi:DNA-binding response OmpR family regulator